MKAIGFTRSLPVEDQHCLMEFEIPTPRPADRELLVRVTATSVNPADAKRRRRFAVNRVLASPVVLGYDAVGEVVEVGDTVQFFKTGDLIWYSGSIHLPGSNAEFQVVDERIAGHRPEKLSDAEAAAIPLTALTAWESLFDRLHINPEGEEGRSLLIFGGAGGVGSIAIQLARLVPGLNVIASASRPITKDWCHNQGAHVVVDHTYLVESIHAAGLTNVDYILNCADTNGYWSSMAELISPEGRIVSIVEARDPVNLQLLMAKSASFAWENMTTRPFFRTRTLHRQHEILEELSCLVNNGSIRSTLTETLYGLSTNSLRQAHAIIESGQAIGKISVVY